MVNLMFSKEKQVPAEAEKIHNLVIATVSQELDRQSKMVSSLYSRATLLIGASGISAALITQEELLPVWLIPITCFTAAIVLAIISLKFQTAEGVDPDLTLKLLEEKDLINVQYSVIHALKKIHDSVRETIKARSRILSAGMIVFGSGWVVTLLILVFDIVKDF